MKINKVYFDTSIDHDTHEDNADEQIGIINHCKDSVSIFRISKKQYNDHNSLFEEINIMSFYKKFDFSTFHYKTHNFNSTACYHVKEFKKKGFTYCKKDEFILITDALLQLGVKFTIEKATPDNYFEDTMCVCNGEFYYYAKISQSQKNQQIQTNDFH